MELIAALTICFLDLVLAQVEPKNKQPQKIYTEGGVMVLTDDNFDVAINEIDHILVQFYAPWCGHCKALAPEFEKAAEALAEKESSVFMAKLDATVHTQVATRFQIDEYPTLKFFQNGKSSDYEGPNEAGGILSWIAKKTNSPIQKINSLKDLENKIKAEKAILIGFFKDEKSENAATYLKTATSYDDVTFYVTSDPKIMEHYNKQKGDIAVLKTFDEKETQFEGDITEENLVKFIKLAKIPLVSDFTDQNAPEIFGSDIKVHLLVLSNAADQDYKQRIQQTREVAKLYRDKMIFAHLDIGKEVNVNILEFFGITLDQCPSFLIYEMEKSAKYLTNDKSITKQNMAKAVEEYFAGKLLKSLISAPIPEDWDTKPLKVLVTANFHKIAKDKLKDVLVMFYAPWCGDCKAISPQWEQLGEKYKDSKDKVIAKMDATANEIDEVQVDRFPTIALFKKQSNDIVIYDGKLDLESFIKFLEMGDQEVNDDKYEDDSPEGVEIENNNYDEENTKTVFPKEDVENENNDHDKKPVEPILPKEEL